MTKTRNTRAAVLAFDEVDLSTRLSAPRVGESADAATRPRMNERYRFVAGPHGLPADGRSELAG